MGGVVVLRGGAQQLPFVQQLGHQLINRLRRDRADVLRIRHDLVEDAFAAAHLFVKDGQAVAQLGLTGWGIMLQLADHHRHRGQWRAHLVRRPCGLCAERHDTFVAQYFFAHPRQCLVALAHRLRHPHHKPGDDGSAQDESQPHAQNVQVEDIFLGHATHPGHIVIHIVHVMHGTRGGGSTVQHGQRHIVFHQEGVAERGQCGHAPGIARRQCRGGDHQRQQVQRDERVGRAAAVVQQDAQGGHVHAQLRKQLRVGNDAVVAQAQPPQGGRRRKPGTFGSTQAQPAEQVDGSERCDRQQHRLPVQFQFHDFPDYGQRDELRGDRNAAQRDQAAQLAVAGE